MTDYSDKTISHAAADELIATAVNALDFTDCSDNAAYGFMTTAIGTGD